MKLNKKQSDALELATNAQLSVQSYHWKNWPRFSPQHDQVAYEREAVTHWFNIAPRGYP